MHARSTALRVSITAGWLAVALGCSAPTSPPARSGSEPSSRPHANPASTPASRPAANDETPPAPAPEAAAEAPADSALPLEATGRCADRTWTFAETSQGACSGHGGIDVWFGLPPRDASARCNDGTYSTSETARGACSHHGGVLARYETKERRR